MSAFRARAMSDLVPTEDLLNEDEDEVAEGYVAPLQPNDTFTTAIGPEDADAMKDKPKRS